jgi:hypothetical protein
MSPPAAIRLASLDPANTVLKRLGSGDNVIIGAKPTRIEHKHRLDPMRREFSLVGDDQKDPNEIRRCLSPTVQPLTGNRKLRRRRTTVALAALTIPEKAGNSTQPRRIRT